MNLPKLETAHARQEDMLKLMQQYYTTFEERLMNEYRALLKIERANLRAFEQRGELTTGQQTSLISSSYTEVKMQSKSSALMNRHCW